MPSNESMTVTHDSETCTAGENGQPCNMCKWSDEQERERQKHPLPDPYTCFDDNGGQCSACLEEIANQRESLALARTRAILDHAEILVEQRQEREQEADDFAEAWARGPQSYKRTTEEESAEYWFRMGGQYKGDQMRRAWNQELVAMAAVREARRV